MYETGSWVVYGIHGVCRVIGREKQLVDRKRSEYLVLEPLGQGDSRFYLPTANPSAMAKLRAVLSARELESLIASDQVREDCWIPKESVRKKRYRDLISNGDRVSLLRMAGSLYCYRAAQTAAGRKFHQCGENFLRDAEKLLSSEIALVLELTPEQAGDYLRTHFMRA